METATWILQSLLALVLLSAGATKLLAPRERLLVSMAWIEDFSDRQVHGIAGLELAATAGLVVPEALGVAPMLTPLAAVGVVVLMSGAARTHRRRGEPELLPINVTIAALAVAVAILRLAG
jgi:hypothetical protein